VLGRGGACVKSTGDAGFVRGLKDYCNQILRPTLETDVQMVSRIRWSRPGPAFPVTTSTVGGAAVSSGSKPSPLWFKSGRTYEYTARADGVEASGAYRCM